MNAEKCKNCEALFFYNQRDWISKEMAGKLFNSIKQLISEKAIPVIKKGCLAKEK